MPKSLSCAPQVTDNRLHSLERFRATLLKGTVVLMQGRNLGPTGADTLSPHSNLELNFEGAYYMSRI